MALIERVVGLQDLSLDVITSILRLLTPEEVLCARLISRYVDSVVLDNIRYVIPSTDHARLNDLLISRVLYRRVPCTEGEVNDNNAVRLVTKLTSLASKIDKTTDDVKHHRRTVCDALTFSKGREWVLDNLRRPAVDTCSCDYTIVLAAWLGLEDVVKACLAKGSSANPQLEHLGSGLYAAAFNNNESLARLLVDHGADIQRREGFYGDALQLAAYRGSDAVIRILIWKLIYADIHSSESCRSLQEYGPFGSSLGAAAAAGHETSIRVLLTWESMLRNKDDQLSWHEVPFFLAVKNGRADVVRLLMNFKVLDHASDGPDGHTPLMAAVAHNQESVVRVLLENHHALGGLDLTIQDDDGIPYPIGVAAERGLLQMLELLLSHQAFKNEGWRDLLANIAEQHASVIELLLERRSFHEQSPAILRTQLLFWAFCSGETRIARLLCEVQDATLFRGYRHSLDEDVLHTAAYYNLSEIITTLLQRDEADPNVLDDWDQTPLMVAAGNNSVECIDALLRDPRTEPDKGDFEGVTALMHAIPRGCPQALQLFKPCDPNMKDEWGRTVFERAMDNENASAVEYLLCRDDLVLKDAFESALAKRNLELAKSILSRRDFDPNANSSLHSAAMHDARVVGLLLARSDVDPNMISEGDTPLHLAIRRHNIEAIRLLLAREDVNPNYVVGSYEAPLEAAVLSGNKQAIQLLLAREDIDINGGRSPPLVLAVSRGEREIVDLLLSDYRINIHMQDELRDTALTRSASSGDVTTLRQLFSKDSTLDLNQVTRHEGTALLLAAMYGHESTVQCLLDMGADVNAQNHSDHTPLHAAAYNGNVEVVELLLGYGANPNLKDKDGNTPYIAAIHAVKKARDHPAVPPSGRY